MPTPIQRAEELLAALRQKRPLNQAELHRLQEEFIIENTYDSNAIEGSTLTLRETALILQEGITIAEKPLKEHLAAIGHKDAFQYVIQLVAEQAPLTERIIREIHALVLMNDAVNKGKYRQVPVQILGAAHTPPQPYLVQPQMEQLLTDYATLQQEVSILEAAATFHLRFEGIHPFIDGNGRTGRLILNLELMKAGFLPVNIKFADRLAYYQSFDDYFAGSKTAAKLTALITQYEIKELERYLQMIN